MPPFTTMNAPHLVFIVLLERENLKLILKVHCLDKLLGCVRCMRNDHVKINDIKHRSLVIDLNRCGNERVKMHPLLVQWGI